jgi:hypothetical protein
MANYRKSSRKSRGQKRNRTVRSATFAGSRRSRSKSQSRSQSHPRRHLQSGG